MSVVEPGGSGDVPIIPDGLYKARITAVKDVTLDEPDRFGNQEKVEIKVDFDVDGEVVSLDPRVNRKWGEKATLFAIAQACGLDPDPYAAFDTDLLKNKQVNILVEQPDETHWPRVKAWSRVRANGTKAAQKAPAASQTASDDGRTPAMITPDYTIDWTVFWGACKKLGITKEAIALETNDSPDDLKNLKAMDPTDVVELFEILKGRHIDPDDLPFEG